RFLDFLRPRDQVVVAPFSVLVGPITGPTADRSTIVEALGAIKSRGGTAILDSLATVASSFGPTEGRRSIVLMTDGYDENSPSLHADALLALKNAQVTGYVIGFGGVAGISLKGERMLRQIASQTGGASFFPPREQELMAAYEKLAADAQHRYLITYTPSN